MEWVKNKLPPGLFEDHIVPHLAFKPTPTAKIIYDAILCEILWPIDVKDYNDNVIKLMPPSIREVVIAAQDGTIDLDDYVAEYEMNPMVYRVVNMCILSRTCDFLEMLRLKGQHDDEYQKTYDFFIKHGCHISEDIDDSSEDESEEEDN